MTITCNTCARALDSDQRYCVSCGSRNPTAHDPAASHLASATRDSRRVAAAKAGGVGVGRSPLMAALLLAIPLALALGVLIGQGSGSDDELLKALKNQPAPVVQVGAGAGAAVRADQSSPQAAKAAPRKTVRRVLAQSSSGPVHDVATYAPSKQQVASDRQQVKACQQLKGTAYLHCQKNLGDIVALGPSTGGNDGAASGQGD